MSSFLGAKLKPEIVLQALLIVGCSDTNLSHSSSDPVDDMADNVEATLSKIRPHTSSSLAHQKAPATLLRAIEATFHEQNTGSSATAYFAALLTTLRSPPQHTTLIRL